MNSIMYYHGLSIPSIFFGYCLVATALSACVPSNLTELRYRLSSNATVRIGVENARWSEYNAPQPGAVITVGSESDVAEVVGYANQHDIPFLAQAGGNGWADTFTLGQNGIVIDLSQLKAISFNADRTEVAFQAGVLIEDLVSAAWASDARVVTGTCNCVSVLGAALGGGLGRLLGLYGHAVDQLVSVNYVDSYGTMSTVTEESDPDLWWALGGAGPNFGIITSVVYKSYPISQANNTAWTGGLYFNDTQIEDVVSAINNLTLEPEMQLDFYFYGGVVLALPFYIGSEEAGREKFAPLLDLGPYADYTEITSYDSWNSAGDSFCADGGRKPTYATNLKAMDPTAWRGIWDEYISFYNDYPEANSTTILTECYSTFTTVDIGKSDLVSYPWRDIKCYAMAIPWYTDSSLDDTANKFGQQVRSYWEGSSGTDEFSAYINFAHGDESLSSIYGASLSRLQQLKQTYDARGRFNQWFPLS